MGGINHQFQPKLVEFGPAGTFGATPLEAAQQLIRDQLACTKPAYKPSLLVTTGLVPTHQAIHALGND